MKKEDAIKGYQVLTEIEKTQTKLLSIRKAITALEGEYKISTVVQFFAEAHGFRDSFAFDTISLEGQRKILYMIEADFTQRLESLEKELEEI